MKKIVMAVFSAFLIVSCSAESRILPEYQPLVDVSYPIVSKEGKSFCSATKIGYETFLTAQHCTEDAENLNIMAKDGTIVKASVLKFDKTNDLALLEAKIDGPSIKVAGFAPDYYQQVAIVGFPLGAKYFLTLGMWQMSIDMRNDELSDPIPRQLVSAPIAPGNSGCGVFAKFGDEWKLVAVAQAVPLIPVGGFVPGLVHHMGIVSDFKILKDFLRA